MVEYLKVALNDRRDFRIEDNKNVNKRLYVLFQQVSKYQFSSLRNILKANWNATPTGILLVRNPHRLIFFGNEPIVTRLERLLRVFYLTTFPANYYFQIWPFTLSFLFTNKLKFRLLIAKFNHHINVITNLKFTLFLCTWSSVKTFDRSFCIYIYPFGTKRQVSELKRKCVCELKTFQETFSQRLKEHIWYSVCDINFVNVCYRYCIVYISVHIYSNFSIHISIIDSFSWVKAFQF